MIKGYINGKIFTSNDDNLYAEAMMVQDGLITWIGKIENFEKDACAQVVDLEGKCVIPGFVDAHMHPVMLADFSKKISCLPPKINSVEELVEAVKEYRKGLKPGQWIEGWGYDEGKFAEKRSPNRYDLDKGCADVPVSILRTCGHIRCVNSKALELAGITKDTPDPQGGKIDRDENGEPTGVLRENARNLVTAIMPSPSKDEVIEEIVDLGKLLLSQGIVAVTDMGNLDDTDSYVYFNEAVQRGFKQEVGVYYFWETFKDKPEFKLDKKHFDRNKQIRVAGLKLIGDGSFSGHTAWVDEPYLGTEDYGISVCSDELLDTAIEFCKEHKCQLSAHAMGGRTISRMVDVAYKEESWTEEEIPYFRVEHVTEPTELSIDKAVKKGIWFVTQPIFAYCEIESYLTNLGEERTKRVYPVKHMLERGVKLAFSTDAPATSWAVPSDPFSNLKSAVTRVAYDGTDCGMDQIIDIETAIKLYTDKSAQVAGFKNLGMLKEGYKADFIVLSDDIFDIKPEDTDKVKVEQTYILGEKVYQL